MALLIAALAAKASTIGNVGQIDRGYQNIDKKLQALGAPGRDAGVMRDKVKVTR